MGNVHEHYPWAPWSLDLFHCLVILIQFTSKSPSPSPWFLVKAKQQQPPWILSIFGFDINYFNSDIKCKLEVKVVNRKQIYSDFASLLDPKAASPAESSLHRHPGAFLAALQSGDEEGWVTVCRWRWKEQKTSYCTSTNLHSFPHQWDHHRKQVACPKGFNKAQRVERIERTNIQCLATTGGIGTFDMKGQGWKEVLAESGESWSWEEEPPGKSCRHRETLKDKVTRMWGERRSNKCTYCSVFLASIPALLPHIGQTQLEAHRDWLLGQRTTEQRKTLTGIIEKNQQSPLP